MIGGNSPPNANSLKAAILRALRNLDAEEMKRCVSFGRGSKMSANKDVNHVEKM